MSDTLLNILPGTMPVDCYPASADAFQKQILALARAVFPGTTAGVAIGDTAPTDHTMVWAKTDASNNLIRFYTWGGTGEWVSLYPVPASSNSIRMLWVGLESDLLTYDEGNGTNIDGTGTTATTGAFWIVDHNFDGRFAVGSTTGAVNPLPSGLVIPPGGTGGEENHSLSVAELAPHTHGLDVFLTDKQGGGHNATPYTQEDPDVAQVPITLTTDSTGGTGSPPVVTPHNNMPPYEGAFYIKRTIRQYYVG